MNHLARSPKTKRILRGAENNEWKGKILLQTPARIFSLISRLTNTQANFERGLVRALDSIGKDRFIARMEELREYAGGSEEADKTLTQLLEYLEVAAMVADSADTLTLSLRFHKQSDHNRCTVISAVVQVARREALGQPRMYSEGDAPRSGMAHPRMMEVERAMVIPDERMSETYHTAVPLAATITPMIQFINTLTSIRSPTAKDIPSQPFRYVGCGDVEPYYYSLFDMLTRGYWQDLLEFIDAIDVGLIDFLRGEFTSNV